MSTRDFRRLRLPSPPTLIEYPLVSPPPQRIADRDDDRPTIPRELFRFSRRSCTARKRLPRCHEHRLHKKVDRVPIEPVFERAHTPAKRRRTTVIHNVLLFYAAVISLYDVRIISVDSRSSKMRYFVSICRRRPDLHRTS